MNNTIYNLFATAPRGSVALLADELRFLNADNIREHPGGVDFSGNLEIAYRACLWLRTANRVLLPIMDFTATNPEAIYEAATALTWEDHLNPTGSFAVEVAGQAPGINHSHYAALRVKDAIVDQFRTRLGVRPQIDLAYPDIRIHLYLQENNSVRLSIDLSGNSLHQRGYRRDGGGIAPLKENLAAAILIRAGWPALARDGATLFDPLCGSATLLIEGAFISSDRAPGLRRDYWGFNGWLGHIPALWKRIYAEAEERFLIGVKQIPPIWGYDAAPSMIRIARANIAAAGLANYIKLEVRELVDFPSAPTVTGLVITNPPYGERLGEGNELAGLYARLGEIFRNQFLNWEAAIFTSDLALAKQLRIRAWKIHPMNNGALDCNLLRFHLTPEWWMNQRGAEPQFSAPTSPQLSSGAQMFANRLRKNLKELSLWAQRQNVACYRVYDADMPEYAVAIDLYHGARRWVHCQEYAAPSTIDPEKSEARFAQIRTALPVVLEIPESQIFFKVRRRQKNSGQYPRLATTGIFYEVREGDATFLVNFTDYLDTGLFLDQRPIRDLIRRLAPGKRFLNLYAYTGTATVQAALARAITTTSVDLSANYLSWARRNLARNGFLITDSNPHKFITADILPWLQEMVAISDKERPRYDLIFLDPPTFSRSKRMNGVLDIQRDHITLLRYAAQLLAPAGIIIFSTNYRRFWLDQAQLIAARLSFEDITAQTIGDDFARNPRIHQCWRICTAKSYPEIEQNCP